MHIFRPALSKTCAPPYPKSIVFKRLPPLDFSCLFFAGSHPLFSITCSLFLQNTRGGCAPPTTPIPTRATPLCFRYVSTARLLRHARAPATIAWTHRIAFRALPLSVPG